MRPNLKKLILGETRAIKNTIRGAIDHAVKEGHIVESQDEAVREMIYTIYEDKDLKKAEKIYEAYEKLRDRKLKEFYDG